jgi:hypothetical protein
MLQQELVHSVVILMEQRQAMKEALTGKKLFES